jgi:hypothetical protein
MNAAVLLTPKVYNDDTVSPGWLGFVVFLALALATFMLLRSFRHHMAKVPAQFDLPADVPGDRPADAPDGPRAPQGPPVG